MSHFLADELDTLDSKHPDYAPRSVDAILAAAQAAGATDIHLQPTTAALELKFRMDGLLLPIASLPVSVAGNVVARLKILAGLLTYHTDRPQEGRIRMLEKRTGTFRRNGPPGAAHIRCLSQLLTAHRVGPRYSFLLRYGCAGAVGRRSRRGEPLATGLPGRRRGADQSCRGPPRPRILSLRQIGYTAA
jgi:type II secretory ATPase GspE/PulE/Tfp pilus assembly ATPase PilB-like protein